MLKTGQTILVFVSVFQTTRGVFQRQPSHQPDQPDYDDCEGSLLVIASVCVWCVYTV